MLILLEPWQYVCNKCYGIKEEKMGWGNGRLPKLLDISMACCRTTYSGILSWRWYVCQCSNTPCYVMLCGAPEIWWVGIMHDTNISKKMGWPCISTNLQVFRSILPLSIPTPYSLAHVNQLVSLIPAKIQHNPSLGTGIPAASYNWLPAILQIPLIKIYIIPKYSHC